MARGAEDDGRERSARALCGFGARRAAAKNDGPSAGRQYKRPDPDSRGREDRSRADARVLGRRGRTPQILEARHYRTRLRLRGQGKGLFLV